MLTKRIAKYDIVSAATPEQLAVAVAELVAQGWEPSGSAFVELGGLYLQPVVLPFWESA